MNALIVGDKFIRLDELKKGNANCLWQIGSDDGIEIDDTFLKQLNVNPVPYAGTLQEFVEQEWQVKINAKVLKKHQI
jgi:hypothetical protein